MFRLTAYIRQLAFSYSVDVQLSSYQHALFFNLNMNFCHFLVWCNINLELLVFVASQTSWKNINLTGNTLVHERNRTNPSRKTRELFSFNGIEMVKNSSGNNTHLPNNYKTCKNCGKIHKPLNLSPTSVIGLIVLVLSFVIFGWFLIYKYNHRTSYNI